MLYPVVAEKHVTQLLLFSAMCSGQREEGEGKGVDGDGTGVGRTVVTTGSSETNRFWRTCMVFNISEFKKVKECNLCRLKVFKSDFTPSPFILFKINYVFFFCAIIIALLCPVSQTRLVPD